MAEPEPPIDLRRGPGRVFRLARRAVPPEVARLPAWARAGWWLPLRTELVLAVVAVACAVVGVALCLAVLYAPELAERFSRSGRG